MRLRTLAAIGIGYALGTRAGEKRYEDMRRLYHDVVESDTFAQVVTRAKESVGEGVRMVTGTTPGWATQDDAESGDERADELSSVDEADEADEGDEPQAQDAEDDATAQEVSVEDEQ